MKTTIQDKQKKITQNVIKFFNDKFGSDQTPIDFETSWPISKWDTLHTSNRTFSVELQLSTGKVLDITEEF